MLPLPTRIGVDLTALDPSYPGGLKTYSLGLLRGLIGLRKTSAAEFTITVFCTRKNYSYVQEIFSNYGDELKISVIIHNVELWKLVNNCISILAWILKFYKIRLFFDTIFRGGLRNRLESEVDALIHPLGLINFYGTVIPSVVCLHDVQQEFFPENFSLAVRVFRWSNYRLTVDRAAVIQVSSDFIKNGLLSVYNFVSTKKIAVIPEGVDLEKFSLSSPQSRPVYFDQISEQSFVFYPAQLWPHKNHKLLLNALSQYKKLSGKEILCVLTGKDFNYLTVLLDEASRLDLEKIVYLGIVPERELLWLYSNAICTLALGLHESSCLPIKEAMAMESPIIAADIEPNVEFSNIGKLSLFKRFSAEDLCEKIGTAVSSSDADSIMKNAELVKNYSWNLIAESFLEKILGLVACRRQRETYLNG